MADRRSRTWRGRRLALAVLFASAPHVAAAAIDADDCAACHASVATHATTTGGHAVVLDCASCHADRRPGRVGPRHRAIARCAGCHDEVGHPERARLRRKRQAQRNCLACHDPHGSTNRRLVRTDVVWRRKVLQVVFTNEAGSGPGGFTAASGPGTGICEVCHLDTDFYRRSGAGEPHYKDPCTACHLHDVHFDPVASDANCALCHGSEATAHALPSGHAPLPCGTCHEEASPTPGPDHRTVKACESCHDLATHAPAGRPPLACAQCHDPHGSENLDLVRAMLTTTGGTTVSIRFDNTKGRAEGSFASPSAPGTGVCEVCHTTTRYYRADGIGEPHYELPCFPCHRHGDGFAP